MFNFKNLFKKDDWRLVKTLTDDFIMIKDESKKGKMYYRLYESNKGKRKMEYQSNLKIGNIHDLAFRLDAYLDTIYPWLEGGYNPDIPKYDEIPEMNTAAALKGKL